MDRQHQPEDLTATLPPSRLATRKWLLDKGMTRHGFDNAVKSGKLTSLARGVVARADIPVTWKGLAASLNRMLEPLVYVGGPTALEKGGFSHYIHDASRVHLYADSAPPSWLARVNIGTEVVWKSNRRLWDMSALQHADTIKPMSDGYQWPWLLASPEQAWLETLADVPGEISFEFADTLMQGLTSLSPRRLDLLLKACRHIKVKRLFFFFASRYDYRWFNQLDPDDYVLGSGKRVLVKEGRLDSRWLITIPEVLVDGQ